MAWVVFVKAIFPCLNLKPNDGLLPYNMPEVFNTTGYGFTDIIIDWDDFKPVFHHFGNKSTYIYCVIEWNWRPSTMVGACVKFFRV